MIKVEKPYVLAKFAALSVCESWAWMQLQEDTGFQMLLLHKLGTDRPEAIRYSYDTNYTPQEVQVD